MEGFFGAQTWLMANHKTTKRRFKRPSLTVNQILCAGVKQKIPISYACAQVK